MRYAVDMRTWKTFTYKVINKSSFDTCIERLRAHIQHTQSVVIYFSKSDIYVHTYKDFEHKA